MLYITTKNLQNAISRFALLKKISHEHSIFFNIKLYFLRQKKYVDHEIEEFLGDISYVVSKVLVASLK